MIHCYILLPLVWHFIQGRYSDVLLLSRVWQYRVCMNIITILSGFMHYHSGIIVRGLYVIINEMMIIIVSYCVNFKSKSLYIYIYIYIYMYICMYMYVYIYIYMYVYIWICMFMCIYGYNMYISCIFYI